MSDRVKKLLLIALSFGTTAVLIGLSIWWVPTLYDSKPTASFSWASEPEDAGGSTSGGSYADGNGTPADNDNTTESPGPVGSGDSGNQGGSGGSAGNGGSDNGGSGVNGGQGGNNSNGGSVNGSAPGSGNKPGQPGGNVTSSKPAKPATSSGRGNSGTPGGEDSGSLSYRLREWFHNDLGDEKNKKALKWVEDIVDLSAEVAAKDDILDRIRYVFDRIKGVNGGRRNCEESKFTEAYYLVHERKVNNVTQTRTMELALRLLEIDYEYVHEGENNKHQWLYFTLNGERYYADFAFDKIAAGVDPYEKVFGSE